MIQVVAGVDAEAEFVSPDRRLAIRQHRLFSVLAKAVCVGACVELDAIRPCLGGGFHLGEVGVEEDREADVGLAEGVGEVSDAGPLLDHVPAVVGGKLAGGVGDECDLCGSGVEHESDEVIRRVAFDVELGRDGFRQNGDIVHADVALVGSWVHGDALGPEALAIEGDLEQIRDSAPACVAEQGDLIDVYTKSGHLGGRNVNDKGRMTEQEIHAADARRRIWVTLAYAMAGALVAQVAAILGLLALGYSIEDLQGGLPALAPVQLMVMLVITQAVSYLLPAIIAARTLFGGEWLRAIGLRPLPLPLRLLVGVMIFVATVPFTAYLAQLNLSVDLSEWQAAIEGDVAHILEEIIVNTSSSVFVVVLLAIALLPAFGEEMVFRGLLQPGFIRMTGSAHFGIWVTAGFFGLVHLQFAGILPRVFLGAVLGFLAFHSQRLWIPIVAHALFNGVQAVAARLGAIDVAAEASEAAGKHPSVFWGLASAAVAAGALHYGLPFLRPDDHPVDRAEDSLLDELEA